MQSLIECLDASKWKEVPAGSKSDNYQEYHIHRGHKQPAPNTFAYVIENDNVDPKTVAVEYCKKDPFSHAALCEFKLSADGNKIIGMDLDGDVVEIK